MSAWFKNIVQALNYRDEKTVYSLRRFAPFESFSDAEIRALAQRCYIRHFAAQEEIYAEGSPSAAVYFIIYGSIGLFKKRRNKVTDRVQAVAAGKFFGETALIDDVVRKHSAKALEKTQAIVLFKSDFNELEQSHPRLALKILKLIVIKVSKELQVFQTEFHELSQKIARDHLME